MALLNKIIQNELNNYENILITGGAGFIGGSVIRNLLINSNSKIFNLDKMGYASNLESIEKLLASSFSDKQDRHEILEVNLTNFKETLEAVNYSNPDLILHLAAESHVDRSIYSPDSFIESNILGTFNLLKASRLHFENLKDNRKNNFRFHHISTDEVFGSLKEEGLFNEFTRYDPRSPYSASKASSDHLVKAWFHTYNFPIIITNCSNNYGPWQYPEKLIPVTIINAINNKEIAIYGDGKNIRDWLYVEDHAEALLIAATRGEVGQSYCIGAFQEKRNIDIVNNICDYLDKKFPNKNSHRNLITFIEDRLGHDRRYAIDSFKIMNELGWKPRHDFVKYLEITIDWYLNNLEWVKKLSKNNN